MNKDRIPYFDFYPADFMHGVRGMTAQEVGVYTMMLCRIYEENGAVEYHAMRLATYCGMREATFVKTIDKLISLGKFTHTDGMISNRRAELEISNRAHKLKINSKAGKASAEKRQQKQQLISTGVERAFNHTDTDTKEAKASNAHVREVDADIAQKQKIDARDLTKKLIEAASGKIQPHGSLVVGAILELINQGVDLEADILPTISVVSSRMQRPASSWAYFVGAIRDAYNNRIKAGEGLAKPATVTKLDVFALPQPEQERKLEFFLDQARLHRRWNPLLGPMPWQDGCRIPEHLLKPDDGRGWQVMGMAA